MVPFRYSGFHDVPRGIVLRYRDRYFFLASLFDEALDDYADTYSVYEFPNEMESIASGSSWDFFRELHLLIPLGSIKVCDLKFDGTRRKEVDPSALDRLI